MEGKLEAQLEAERPWQADLCQFFTRDKVAEVCLSHVAFPENILTLRLLDPAAGQGAFFLPLLPRLVEACRAQRKTFDLLKTVICAYEVDREVATILRTRCVANLEELGVPRASAKAIAQAWVKNEDFLETRPRKRFTHVVSNPPYIRWDAIPVALRDVYKTRFKSFKQRADLYVAFIEHALGLLAPHGQLAFLCPGTWTRNVYGNAVRESFTSQGQLKTIIDFSDVDSFETSADAYPHFFVFQKDAAGPTKISSVIGSDKIERSGNVIIRTFSPSALPLLLTRDSAAQRAVEAARRRFPKLEDAGCTIRVGSATGCNSVFLGDAEDLGIERSRLLPFVNASSIHNGKVRWAGTQVVNVFDKDAKVVKLSKFPRMAAYLRKNKKSLQSRAKASQSKIWWRTIDVLHPDWYAFPKLLVVDVSAEPVIGIDTAGYCAGSGVYQIKSDQWPLADLLTFLSAGVLGLFVASLSTGAKAGFHRFQKNQIAAVHIPRWTELTSDWKKQFKLARKEKDGRALLNLIAGLYECEASLLENHVARDWNAFCSNRPRR
ncbi:Eco57I restriction-modification methylase domain-containing protein [Bradyrhizobium sp. Arg816]|uniref:Eco57I restriction-modification methylase domain-containing protein n=1 Tax=Bradyrhizobium sp. Arg816 TaxID=2998491 RepID=UPI00249E7703|nr:N-6 DNA methylase [Bradyrhizobium sp. Arg816]MDI3561123.1 N-6 DNA methylase [Bradyrhizobium sp. Arg816]